MQLRAPDHATLVMRWQLLAGSLFAAACTSTQPPPPIEVAPVVSAASGVRQLTALTAVDGQRALFFTQDRTAGAAWLSLAGDEGPPAWTFALPTPISQYGEYPAPQVAAGIVTIPWMAGKEYRGLVGLDLETGAERWRAPVLAEDLLALKAGRDHIQSLGDAVQRIEVVGGHERLGVMAFDLATGTRQWTSMIEGGGWHGRRNVLAPDHLIFASGLADPDDPDNDDEKWHFLRRSDGERVLTIDGADAACVVDHRFYVQRGDAIAVVDLRAPELVARELLARVDMPGLAGPGTLIACREYGGLPVLISEHEYRATQLVGLDAAGAVAWRISLGERRISRSDFLYTGNESLTSVLPPFLALVTESMATSAIVIVDLAGRQIAREMVQNIPQWFDAYVFAMDGRFLVTLGVGDDKAAEFGEARRFTRLLAAIDSASGNVDAAVMVLGMLPLRPEHAAGGQLWLAASTVGEDGSAPRMRLDLATLRATKPPPTSITLDDGAAELRAALTLGDDGPPWRARPGKADIRVSPARPKPQAARRRVGAGPIAPTWDLAPMVAEAAQACGAPASARSELMAWEGLEDGRKQRFTGALVGLEYDDPTRGHVWCLAVVNRVGQTEQWRIHTGGSHSPNRRRVLRQRPTNADVYKLLDSGNGWTFAGEHGSWVADGDIMDAAWQTMTGQAPTRFLVRKK